MPSRGGSSASSAPLHPARRYLKLGKLYADWDAEFENSARVLRLQSTSQR